MSKRDLFIIVIRIIGLYGLLRSLLMVISQVLLLAAYPMKSENIYGGLAPAVLYSLIWLLVIIFSVSLVKLLGLEKGFDDKDIRLGNIDIKKILVFAIVLVAGTTIINGISDILYHATMLFKYSVDTDYKLFNENMSIYKLIISVIKLVVGILLLTNYDRIAAKLMIRDRKL